MGHHMIRWVLIVIGVFGAGCRPEHALLHGKWTGNGEENCSDEHEDAFPVTIEFGADGTCRFDGTGCTIYQGDHSYRLVGDRLILDDDETKALHVVVKPYSSSQRRPPQKHFQLLDLTSPVYHDSCVLMMSFNRQIE